MSTNGSRHDRYQSAREPEHHPAAASTANVGCPGNFGKVAESREFERLAGAAPQPRVASAGPIKFSAASIAGAVWAGEFTSGNNPTRVSTRGMTATSEFVQTCRAGRIISRNFIQTSNDAIAKLIVLTFERISRNITLRRTCSVGSLPILQDISLTISSSSESRTVRSLRNWHDQQRATSPTAWLPGQIGCPVKPNRFPGSGSLPFNHLKTFARSRLIPDIRATCAWSVCGCRTQTRAER